MLKLQLNELNTRRSSLAVSHCSSLISIRDCDIRWNLYEMSLNYNQCDPVS